MPKDMDLGELSQSVSELKNIFETFKEKNDGHLEELKSGWDDVVRKEELDRINEALNETQEKTEKLLAAQKRMAVYGDPDGPSAADLDQKALEWAGLTGKARGEVIKEYGHADMQEYKKAFNRYLRKDDKTMIGEEAKALSVGSDPDGGYVVYPDMSGRISGRIFETSPVRQYAAIQTIGTDALEGLRDDDEASSGWVGETEARAETDTPQLGKWRIPVHEQYAKPSATQKLLDDASIDMEAWLAGKVADKFARTENAAFVNGDGVGKPRGFLTYADYAAAGVYEVGAIEQFDTGANGAFVAAPNGGDVLINTVYGLKAAYRQRAVWMMNRSTTGLVRKVKDSDGEYIWRPGIVEGQPATILSYPVASFEDMPDPATGSLSIAFGDLGEAYQIVDRLGIRVLRDPYSNKPYVEFYTTKRVGGDVINFEALKLVNFQT